MKHLVLLLVAAYHLTASPLGSTPSDAAFSARQILLAGFSTGSGLYWMDPDGAGIITPYQFYADMDTDGDGWTLAVNSLQTSPAPTTDMVANTGTVGLTTGYTLNAAHLAIEQDAQIRHRIVNNAGTSVLDAYYMGNYHDPLPSSAYWTFLVGNASVLDSFLSYHYGRGWSTAANDIDGSPINCAVVYGVPWYYNSCYNTIPSSYLGSSLRGPMRGGAPLQAYQIFVRETNTRSPAAPVPEPSTSVLLTCGAALVFMRTRSIWRAPSRFRLPARVR